jgi:Organic solute transporter Ostalpha
MFRPRDGSVVLSPGRRGSYDRVPAGSIIDGDINTENGNANDNSSSAANSTNGHPDTTASDQTNDGEDSLHQSLLSAEEEIRSSAGTWHSPPQLHFLLERAIETWNLIFPHIRPLGNFLFGITLLTMLVAVPMVTYTAIREQRFDFAAFDSSGVMVLGTLVLSFRLVYLHLSHWYMPQVQKYVVRIVWMVPLYAVQSWLSLRFREARIYINAIRDLYEAFVIASFLYYLIELLGGQQAMVRTLESKAVTHPNLGKHTWPLNQVLADWPLGIEFMLQCKHGVLQYVVTKTIATILTYMFELTGFYGEGDFQWDTAYPYLAFLLNTSVMYALYSLVMLFHAVHEELQYPINWRPLGKFLCVKGVVFFTWWQGVVIYFLKYKGFIKDTGSWKGREIANAVIDYCICTEMVFFAIAHSYTFTYKEYLPSSIPPELRNLTLNANLYANSITSTTTLRPLQLEPLQSSEPVSPAVAANSRPSVQATYRAPAVLDHPLNFKEAFWSSSIPKETLVDIQRLRHGVDNVVQSESSTCTIGLSEALVEAEAELTAVDATAAVNTAHSAALSETHAGAEMISATAMAAANSAHSEASESAQGITESDEDLELQSQQQK